MRAVAYVNKFLRAKGRGGGNNFKNLDSLLGLKPVLVPPKFLGRFTPLMYCSLLRLQHQARLCIYWYADWNKHHGNTKYLKDSKLISYVEFNR